MKKQNIPTLADSICDFRVRKIKKQFFTQINTLLDWNTISQTIDKYYKKGQSASGCSSYDRLLLFKMCLLQTWYGLSDYEVEDRINDSLSFSYFCGLTIEQTAPLSRFRTAMTKADTYNKLFKDINKQLEDKGILVKKGVLADASVVDNPLRPKGKTKHKVTQDRQDEEEVSVEKDYPASVEQEGAWSIHPIDGNAEVDETVFGGQEEGVRGRKNANKKLVVVGIEKKVKGVSRLYARVIPNASSDSLGSFMKTHIAPSANIKTDQWTGYKPLKNDFINLEQIPSGKKGCNFKELHRVIMNLKAWLRGVHHHVNDLQAYLDQYCYRFNRSFMKENIFDNLMIRMVKTEPCCIKNLCSS